MPFWNGRSTYQSPWRARDPQGRSRVCAVGGGKPAAPLRCQREQILPSAGLQGREEQRFGRTRFTRAPAASASVRCALGAQPSPYFERISGSTSRGKSCKRRWILKQVSRVSKSYLRGRRDSSQSHRHLLASNTRSSWVRIKSCSRLCASENLGR